MNAASLEVVLARLYVDARFRARFLADPGAATRSLRLSPDAVDALAQVDRDALELFCALLERKRANVLAHSRVHGVRSWRPRRLRVRIISTTHRKESIMLRVIGQIQSLLGAAALFAALAQPAIAQEVEPNNSCFAAQFGGEVVPPALVTGSLDPSSATLRTDVDFLRFTATPGLPLRLTVTADSRVGLFDEQCALIAATQPFSVGPIDFDVPPSGQFIAAVADPFDNAFTGNGFLQGGPWQVAFALQPPSIDSISGRLIDALSGEPLLGGTTPFGRVDLLRCSAGSCSRFVASQATDAAGTFRFEVDNSGRRIEVGDFELRAFADEYQMISRRFAVEADESLDLGDVALIPPPILFSDVQPCEAILPQGGTCTYSVRIRNNTIAKLDGLARSVVEVGFGSSSFEAGTRSTDSDVRRASVRIAALDSQVVSFAFDVPSFLRNGTTICAGLDLGFEPSPLFNRARSADLFCMNKGDSGFRVMSPLETHTELERRRQRGRSAPESIQEPVVAP